MCVFITSKNGVYCKSNKRRACPFNLFFIEKGIANFLNYRFDDLSIAGLRRSTGLT